MTAIDDRMVKVLVARDDGGTLRQAAKAAGVHVATVCRWQNRVDWFGSAMLDAARLARRRRRFSTLPLRRPPVPWHPDCPLCGRPVVVRTAVGMLRFWRCSQWPRCTFASWRPRAPDDCSECGGIAFGLTPGGRLRAGIAETGCERFYTNFFAGPLPPSPGCPPGSLPATSARRRSTVQGRGRE